MRYQMFPDFDLGSEKNAASAGEMKQTNKQTILQNLISDRAFHNCMLHQPISALAYYEQLHLLPW
jgi:hypothetical protein